METPAHARWLTPVRCRVIFAALVAFNFVTSLRFLTHACPLDLSGDEAQYWDWSRQLSIGYYSKPPMIAGLIRASCSALGQTMPAIRLPALVLAAGTSLCTYWLTRKLFASDRLALGAFLLGAIVPMFAAGSVLMTIDPPLYFFWALATCFVAKALADDRRWPWVAAGVAAALGVLTKWGMPVWLLLVLVFLAIDRPSRRWLRTPWPWTTCGIALLGFIPPLVWNAGHGWVTFQHVFAQIGLANRLAADAASKSWWQRVNPGSFVASQFGILNPAVAVFMLAGVGYALRDRADPNRRWLLLLVVVGGGFWLLTFADAFISHVEPNWPAPAYFTLLIVAAYFAATRLHPPATWRRWRGLAYGGIAFGLLAGVAVRNATALYPAVAWANRTFTKVHLKPGVVDPAFKLRGVRDTLAPAVAAELARIGRDPFVLCEAYEDTAELAFYLPNQPRTYFAGSYWTELERTVDGKVQPIRRRWTQYDVWPDRALDQPALKGRDAVYVGLAAYPPLAESFASVTEEPAVVARVNGLDVRTWRVWRCRGFKGMTRPAGSGPR